MPELFCSRITHFGRQYFQVSSQGIVLFVNLLRKDVRQCENIKILDKT